MNEQTTIASPGRALLTAKVGLIGLAAAAILAAVVLAAGAWAAPGGTRAATGNTPADPGLALANGVGPMHGGKPGRMGDRGFGGGITITAISGSNVSLKTADGWTRTIAITSSTVLEKAGAKITLGDLKVGDEVRFRQTRQSDGTFTIDQLVVVLPHVDGKVTAISGSTITVQRPDGSTAKIVVGSSTTFRVNGASGALSGIKVGMVVMAEGTKASDGTLTAAVVRAFDPSKMPGPGMGRHGMGHRFDADGAGPNGQAPNATTAPGASGTTNNG